VRYFFFAGAGVFHDDGSRVPASGRSPRYRLSQNVESTTRCTLGWFLQPNPSALPSAAREPVEVALLSSS
jgi:hypothetical protein